jgi:ribosomal protein S18 acetylase RimI-like enzyme
MDPPIDPASDAAAAALDSEPFYRSIAVQFAADGVRRRAVLSRYLDYSIAQGLRIGRVVHLETPALGVAIWLLPQGPQIEGREGADKRGFLQRLLGEAGCASYQRIVAYMSERAHTMVGREAWYLSILAVAPQEQGRGLGRRLLAPTLAEADSALRVCYLETFGQGNLGFYERFGFVTRAEFTEPTTGSPYALMMRPPGAGLTG